MASTRMRGNSERGSDKRHPASLRQRCVGPEREGNLVSWWPGFLQGTGKYRTSTECLQKYFLSGFGGKKKSCICSVHSGGLPQLRTPLQWAVTHTRGPLPGLRSAGGHTLLQWGPELEEAS